MNMTSGQWGQVVGSGGKALDAPNAQAYAVQVARAGRCVVMPGWETALQTGAPIQLLCYDSAGIEAGSRYMAKGERDGVLGGVRWVTPEGYLSMPGEVRTTQVGMPVVGDTGFGGVVMLAAVAAAGWWAYENWGTVKGWTGLNGLADLFGGSPKRLPRERPLRKGGDVDTEDMDDDD
jgi:hypothetical protein